MNGKRDNRTEHSVNEAHVSWDDEYELYEEYAALAITTPRVDNRPRYDDKGRSDGRDRQKTYSRDGQNNGNREAREAYITKVFCNAPCACCGSGKHAMLSPIRTADGKPQTSEYICPVAMCENWNEARKTKPVKLRFAPCPKKFAAACKHDTNQANAALKDYVEQGSGKFRDPTEREAFTNDVMKACKATTKSSGGTRVVGSISKEERCNSGQIEFISEQFCNNINIEMAEGTSPNLSYIVGESIGMSEERVDEDDHEGCIIIETYNVNGVTKAPSPLTHSSLHLLVASKVEPPTRTEIQQFMEKNFEGTINRNFDEYSDGEDTGCWVLMEMAYGAEYIVPYKMVHGRILADTGSTTTLINENFAMQQGLDIRSTGSGQILLRDVNDGISQLTKQCFLRLTLTTVEGELISFIILAFCTDKLKHDILLGTRDLERYKIDVSSHRGEAKMELLDGVVAFPMLDSAQITHLQKLASGNNDQC
jgi:hypothetical protein